MKKCLLILWCLPFWANAQMFSDKITRELKFEKVSASNTLILANINGSVKCRDNDGDKILIEPSGHQGKNRSRLEQGKTEMQWQQI